MITKKFTTEVGGRTLSAEFTNLAEQANGSCLLTYGGTVVFATAVQSKNAREGIDFFPLVVDYEEKFYAAGMILGSRFMRREGKASDEAILVSRLIDRCIRPLFNYKMRNDVQVVVMALSVDEENGPDIPAILAASLALGTSDIAWAGPLAAVRIAKIDNEFVINPTHQQLALSGLDVVISGKEKKINMIEAGAKEVSEEDMVRALEIGAEETEKLCKFQREIIAEVGKYKTEPKLMEATPEMNAAFKKHIKAPLEEALYIKEKLNRYEALNDLKKEWMKMAASDFADVPKGAADILFEDAVNDVLHDNIIDHEKRPDGRSIKELRPLFAHSHLLPRAHGTGLFYRGETHVLSILTLGAPSDVQLIEGMEVRTKKRFMHHYNFPGFSSGEVKPMRGPGRREIGHGALAERALSAVIPDVKDFPYTIRVVSETLSSNGSTSMGSVCASTLALMDAGVPIKAPVGGIAMGLMMRSKATSGEAGNNYEYKVLTDLQGPEDHHGDMDFKVAGTREGITAVQMDVKVEGIPLHIMKEAFYQTKDARMKILDVIAAELPAPKSELSPFAPRILTMTIDPDKIRDVIGPGGKVINSIIAVTGADIDIEQDGTIFITAPREENLRQAEEAIKSLTKTFEVGEVLKGTVTRIFPFGAMVEIGPKQEGLVHISELAPFRVNQVTDVVAPGDEVSVQVMGVDEKGRVNLSIKAVMSLELKPEHERARGETEARTQQEERERKERGRNGGGGGGFRGRR